MVQQVKERIGKQLARGAWNFSHVTRNDCICIPFLKPSSKKRTILIEPNYSFKSFSCKNKEAFDIENETVTPIRP